MAGEKHFPITDGRCEQNTHSYTSCTDAHSVSAHTLNSMTTFHQANTRGSRAHSSGLHALVSQSNCNPTCHVSFLAALDTDYQHKFSLTYLTCLSVVLSLTPEIFWRTIHVPCEFHGGAADLLKSHLPHCGPFPMSAHARKGPLSLIKMTPAIHKSLDDFDFAIASLIAACHQAVFAFLRICPSFLVSGNSK